MGDVYQLPDLGRMRAIEDRIRQASDEEVAELLASEDGLWLTAACGRVMAWDVLRRIVAVIDAGVPSSTLDGILGVQLLSSTLAALLEGGAA